MYTQNREQRTMPLSKLSFDELNRPEYEEYFSKVRVSEEEKQKRIETALQIEEAALLGFSTVQYDHQINQMISWLSLQRALQESFRKVAKQYVDDDFMENHVRNTALNIALTTYQNLQDNYSEDSYWLSDDRAVSIAKTESSVILDHTEYAEARRKGYRYKRWDTVMDGKERETHGEANGQIALIGELFEVGGALMMHPCDDSLGAGVDEIVNCRCSCTFLK